MTITWKPEHGLNVAELGKAVGFSCPDEGGWCYWVRRGGWRGPVVAYGKRDARDAALLAAEKAMREAAR